MLKNIQFSEVYKLSPYKGFPQYRADSVKNGFMNDVCTPLLDLASLIYYCNLCVHRGKTPFIFHNNQYHIDYILCFYFDTVLVSVHHTKYVNKSTQNDVNFS